MRTNVLVIGGGLSGLHTTYSLQQLGVDVLLAEAREHFGGRILSHRLTQSRAEQPGYDLGPAWFWPGQQHIRTLIDELRLAGHVFEQASDGDALFEDESGRIHRGISGISMGGSYRLSGGMQQLISALVTRLSKDNVLLAAKATKISFDDGGVTTTLDIDGVARDISSAVVVLALPPRLAVSTIVFDPTLAQSRLTELASVPTWMAGHAKLLVFYATPFWRNLGLSGDIISQCGPLHEIHDASPVEGGPHALFGFVGTPAHARRGKNAALLDATHTQLKRLFSGNAETPLNMVLKDWAADPLTATEDDQAMMTAHPTNQNVSVTEVAWGERIVWSGTETATGANFGYLEGALVSSKRTLALLSKHSFSLGTRR